MQPDRAGSGPRDGTAGPDAVSRGRARYALAVLVAVYVFNMVDRNILNVLLEHIKAELQVSDTQLGLLIGPAFAIFYTFAGLPIARLADRYSRRNVIALGLAIWSLMTAVSAFVRSFPQLLLARIGVGVGEASCSPAAHSMISDLFPPERRATAFSIYALGGPVGGIVGFLVGGWVAELYGWRPALLVVGMPGIAFALFVWLTLREPPRGAYDQAKPPETSLWEVMRFMGRMRAMRHLLLGAAVHSFASVAVASWHAPFLMRVHEMGAGQAGSWLAALSIVSALGTFAGGPVSDRLARSDSRWYLWATGWATLGAVPFYLGFYLWPGRGLALAMAAPAVLLAAFFFGPVIAMTQSLVRSNMRAVASAVMLSLNNIIGYGLGPLAVGWVSDLLEPRMGALSIRYALLIVIVTNLWAAGHFFLGARTLRRDLEARDATEPAR